jgi:uncharacterized membrane protein
VWDFLSQLFATVCGQHLDHTWTPGGWVLPFCQRCTGLYVGACLATLLQLWLKPRPTTRSLWFHGACLLQMVPFGYHWLPQGPVLRTITGVFFAFGLVQFLWLLPAARGWLPQQPVRTNYLAALLVSVALVPAWGRSPSPLAAVLLATLATIGLVALAVLVVVNLVLLAAGLLHVIRPRPPLRGGSVGNPASEL